VASDRTDRRDERGLTDAELDRALDVARELADWACETIRRPRRTDDIPREKASPADIVTATDEAVETHVRAVLRRAFPGHGIEGEEFGTEGSVTEGFGTEGSGSEDGAPAAPRWVVDPVDGTTNYAHGIGWSSFSLGLADAMGRPLLGVVADPYRGETFTAVRGRGAELNGVRIRAAAHTGLRGHVVMTEWAAHAPWPGMPDLLAELSARWCTVRVMGSTALSLAQVAAGRATAAVIGGYHAVDGLPALVIGQESGALAYDDLGALSPARPVPHGGLLLAAPDAAAEIAELWDRCRHP
jgi:myo-inositol-1(or 4)-monophosphatase